MDVTVIDVRVFTRDGVDKDSRALSIEKAEIERVRKDFADQQRILEDDLYQRVRGMLIGQSAAGGPRKLKAGTKITAEYLDEVPREEWFEIRLEDEDANSQLEQDFGAPEASEEGVREEAGRQGRPRSPRAMISPRACSRWSRCTWR